MKYMGDGFEATEEQSKIIDAAVEGKSIKVMALAGTGKTSTAKMITKYVDKKSVYVCFNKSVADKAKKEFPSHVDPRTLNSIAYGSVMRNIKDKSRLKFSLYISDFEKALPLAKPSCLSSVRETLNNFCISDDKKIQERHVAGKDCNDFLKSQEILRALDLDPETDKPMTAKDIVNLAEEYWDKTWNKFSKVSFTHDFYVKQFELNNPKINADMILIDEAQDLNPVAVSILNQQKNTQMIWIGDSNQQIYQWRGSINQMETLELEEFGLTSSFRFGPDVAEMANHALDFKGSKYRLKGKGFDTDVVYDEPPESCDGFTVIARTNMNLFILALEETRLGKKIYLPSYKDSKAALWSAYFIKNDQPEKAYYKPFLGIKDWSEFEELAEVEREMAMIASFFESFSGNLKQTLDSIETCSVKNPEDADVLFYTAHKAKGEEWDKVLISDEFDDLGGECKTGELDGESINVFYVAMTRGIKKVHINSRSLDVFEP